MHGMRSEQAAFRLLIIASLSPKDWHVEDRQSLQSPDARGRRDGLFVSSSRRHKADASPLLLEVGAAFFRCGDRRNYVEQPALGQTAEEKADRRRLGSSGSTR